jgi:outer-membrane receptor for ferric coprogen and ferric-rhodotorulic acid
VRNLRVAQACAVSAFWAIASIRGAAQAAEPPDETRQLGAIQVYTDEAAPDSYAAPAASSATGLDLSLRDTPQSVTVITRERIDDQKLATLFDVLRETTGVSVQPVDRGRSTLAVRGFEVNNFQFDGVPTALYHDNNVNTAMFDRIEVVRGATGLLSGAGDPSATVNMVRKHAVGDRFMGDFSVELGSWNQLTGTVDLNTPLNAEGSVRARWVAQYSDQDAFIDYEHTRNTLLYGVIDAELGEDTLLSVGFSDQRDRRDGVLWAGLPFWHADGSRTDWRRSRSTATRWNQWDVDERTLFATLRHQFANEWTIRGDASYVEHDDEERMLWMWGDPHPVTGEGMEAYPYHYFGSPQQTHFDLIASGPFSAWGREHQVTFGVMHSKLRDNWSNRDAVEPVASFPVGNFFEWDGSYPQPELGPRYEASNTTTTQTAAYAATQLQLTDPFKLIVGARVSNWEREELARVWVPEAYTITHDGVVTPYAGLVYDLGRHFSAYASYTSIFNPQTSRDRNGDYLDPLEGNGFEAGIKGEFLEGRLNGSAAVFRIDQDNFAVPDVGYLVPGTPDQAFRTTQGVEAEGYELELVGELLPRWSLSFGWTHYSARDADDQNVAVDHPRRQLKLFTKYRFTGAAEGLSLGGGVAWSGQQPARAENPATGEQELIGQGAYALVDLLARYQFGERLAAQLNVVNLLDKEYLSRNTGWWGGPFTVGAPRHWRVSMSYSFD